MFSLPVRERNAERNANGTEAYGTQLRFSNLKQSIFAANLHREVELVIPVLSTRKADPITRLGKEGFSHATFFSFSQKITVWGCEVNRTISPVMA